MFLKEEISGNDPKFKDGEKEEKINKRERNKKSGEQYICGDQYI